ncbi:MAG: OsmC family protein [Desulfobacterales bacterium]|nr:OsmC family protein [Desulfobacterales bacterium]
MAPFHVIFPGNKRVDVKFKDFLVKTDQSKKNEGDNTAPEPFALFLASLASCAGIYAKSFCDTRELNTEGMNLELTPFFKKGQKHMDKIEITLHVNQKFPEKYIKPIIKAMSACAVKNQLNPEIGSDIRVAYLEE